MLEFDKTNNCYRDEIEEITKDLHLAKCIEDVLYFISSDITDLRESFEKIGIKKYQEIHIKAIETANNIFDDLYANFFDKNAVHVEKELKIRKNYKYYNLLNLSFLEDFKIRKLRYYKRIYLFLYYFTFYYCLKFEIWEDKLNKLFSRKFP